MGEWTSNVVTGGLRQITIFEAEHRQRQNSKVIPL